MPNTLNSNTDSATGPDGLYDVVIIGAGLVGAALACALATGRAGRALRIGVVEAGAAPKPFLGQQFDPRVVALTRASQSLFETIGAWPAIIAQRACPYGQMHVWDGEGTASIHFDCREVQQPNLGHIVENSVALAASLEQLHRHDNIELLQPARVESLIKPQRGGDAIRLLLEDGRCLQSQLLIAADGANSFVRRLANFQTREWDYGHKAIVTTVRTGKPHQYTAWQRFMQTGPLAFLPLQPESQPGARLEPDSCFSSIVWSAAAPLADELMALDDRAFCQALGAALEWRLGEVEHSDKRFCLPLRQRHAVQYIQPGIALAGDAAHSIHPLAGQGVNLGLLDAAVLRQEIHRAVDREIPLSDASILRRYQRQRLGNNLGMMGAMEAFKRLFGSRQLPLRWLRNEGMAQLDNLPMLKNFMIKQAMGL